MKELLGMRAYEELADITIPKEQEEMMNIICDAWEDCRSSMAQCKDCPDRPHKNMRMMACTALKYTRLLLENGYSKQNEGEWLEDFNSDYYCSKCGTYPKSYVKKHECPPYCPNCGAKMR